MFQPSEQAPPGLAESPAVRLNFKFEADVPAPDTAGPAETEERNAAVSAAIRRLSSRAAHSAVRVSMAMWSAPSSISMPRSARSAWPPAVRRTGRPGYRGEEMGWQWDPFA